MFIEIKVSKSNELELMHIEKVYIIITF